MKLGLPPGVGSASSPTPVLESEGLSVAVGRVEKERGRRDGSHINNVKAASQYAIPTVDFLSFSFLFKELVYLFDLEREIWRNKDRASIFWVAPQMVAVSGAGPDQNQEPAVGARSTWAVCYFSQASSREQLGHELVPTVDASFTDGCWMQYSVVLVPVCLFRLRLKLMQLFRF